MVSPEARLVPREGIVPIASDRPDEAEPLVLHIRMVLDRAVVGPLGILPPTALFAIALDIAANISLPARGPLARALITYNPFLVLARERTPTIRRLSATTSSGNEAGSRAKLTA